MCALYVVFRILVIRMSFQPPRFRTVVMLFPAGRTIFVARRQKDLPLGPATPLSQGACAAHG